MGPIVPWGLSARPLNAWSACRVWPGGPRAPAPPLAQPEAWAPGLVEVVAEAMELQPRANFGGERAQLRVSARACWAGGPLPVPVLAPAS